MCADFGIGDSLFDKDIVIAEKNNPKDKKKKNATNKVPTKGILSDFSGNLSDRKIIYIVMLSNKETP